MHRRHLLFTLPIALPLAAAAQNLDLDKTSPVDAVAFYVVPTDGIGENAVAGIARTLTKAFKLLVKATAWTPSDVNEPFPGSNQYPAEDYLPIGARLARTLRDVSPRTYFIVVTDRDINSRSQNFRFQYSLHGPMQNTSVLSIARLVHNADGSRADAEVIGLRALKMLVRIVGEMRLGWKRSSQPQDVMYAPIMSIDDIDRMDLEHTLRAQAARR